MLVRTLVGFREAALKRLVSVLVVGVSMAVAAPGAAQDETVQAPPDLATLEALCRTYATDLADEGRCLYVVHPILLPGTGRSSRGHELRDAPYHDGGRSRPMKVDWNADLSGWYTGSHRPEKGKKYVAVLVEFTAGEDGDRYYESHWGASDRKGVAYEHAYPELKPALGSGHIRPGEMVQGWVTFEVPRKTKWLEISYEQPYRDTLYWTIKDEKGK